MNALCAAHDHDLDVGGTLWRAGLWIKLWKTRYLSVDINHYVQPRGGRNRSNCTGAKLAAPSVHEQRTSTGKLRPLRIPTHSPPEAHVLK